MAFPSLTQEWHSKSYPAIDSQRPELSQKGKVVAITGAGGSIGGATALAFAKAGANKIAVLGRRANLLEDTKKEVEAAIPGTTVLVTHCDIAKADSVRGAFGNIKKELGEIDILVCAAGYLSDFHSLTDAEPDEWWRGFEINTRGAFNVTRALLSNRAPKAILVDISTCFVYGFSVSILSSKLAATKIYETFGAENPQIEVFHIHLGVVYSELNVKSGVTATEGADLPACFTVWACSDEGKFVRGQGKYLWSNWDVDELKSRKEELSKPSALAITLNGWPFGQEGDGGKGALKF